MENKVLVESLSITPTSGSDIKCSKIDKMERYPYPRTIGASKLLDLFTFLIELN
jgi:hypothetical protein